MAPRGVAAFFTTLIVGRLVGKIPMRWMLCFGFSMLAYSSFMLERHQSPGEHEQRHLAERLNGIAISFIFVPLTTATMSQLGQQQIGNASGLYNLMRNLGGSIGIAFVTTMLARGAQTHQALMVGHLTPTDPAFVQQLAAAQHALAQHTDPVTATHQAYGADLRTAGPAGAFVGVCGQFPFVRADGAVLPPADSPVQTGQTRAGAAGGSGIKCRQRTNFTQSA